jgi:acyl-CoA synthetase (AMP-forming)/AMP-acid ligase II
MADPLGPTGLVPRGWRNVADQLRAAAATHPDKIALQSVDDGRALSWGALAAWAGRLGHFLAARGIAANDRIAVLGGNSIEQLILYYAVQSCGATYCTVNVEVNEHHLWEMLERIEPRLVFWEQGLDPARLGAGRPGEWIGYGRHDDPDSDGLFAILEGFAAAPDISPANGPEDRCVISFTSGTSAAPKAVLHDFCNYYAIAEHQCDRWSLTEADRILDVRSFTWASAHMLSLNPVLLVGGTLLFARDFSRSRFFGWLRTYRPTIVVAVPTVVNMLLERQAAAERDAFGGVRFLSCSTAPLMPDNHRRFEDTYGVPLVQLYGMSEGGVVAANRPESRLIGSVGRPGLYQQLSIVGPGGEPLPPGAPGEIETVSAQHAHAYLHADRNIEPIRGRPLRTGDIGYLDDNGFLHVTGRAKDVIIRGGVNIAPLEIDAVLSRHPDIAEAATFGVPDPVWGEAVASWIVKRPGSVLTEDAVRAHCATELPAAKCPAHIVIADTVPRNDRGKIDRNRLRATWEHRHKDAVS